MKEISIKIQCVNGGYIITKVFGGETVIMEVAQSTAKMMRELREFIDTQSLVANSPRKARAKKQDEV